VRRGHGALPRPWHTRSDAAFTAQRHAAYLESGDERHLAVLPSASRGGVQLLRSALVVCPAPPVSVSVAQLQAVAEGMLPYLAPGEGGAAWRRLGASPCLGKELAPWIALYLAIDARDAAVMAAGAEALLAVGGAGPESQAGFLAGAAVTGRLATGERDRALATWTRNAEAVRMMQPRLLEFLAAHLAAAGMPRTEAK
jgi:hypothetical protein